MKPFSYMCDTRIEMGVGASAKLPDYLASVGEGKSVLLVSDPGVFAAGIVTPILSALEESGYRVHVFRDIVQNPRDVDCVAGAERFREVRADFVVSIGGGSAMDTAKAIALLGPGGGTPTEYADGLRGYVNPAPVICVPTTAGTGSEVTRSSVITESTTHRKMTLKHAWLRPRLAILDPALTLSVPPSVTAATGVDALVHAIEGYSCLVTNPISQALGARAMAIIVPALPTAYRDPQNLAARSAMLEGSLLAGLCFGSADVAAVHCLAEALGGLYDTPHGLANAVFLPHVLRFNAQVNTEMHATMARIMGFAGDDTDDATAVVQMIDGVEAWTKALGIPRLRDIPGVREADFPRLVELSVQNGSTPSNVRPITAKDYARILENTFGNS